MSPKNKQSGDFSTLLGASLRLRDPVLALARKGFPKRLGSNEQMSVLRLVGFCLRGVNKNDRHPRGAVFGSTYVPLSNNHQESDIWEMYVV